MGSWRTSGHTGEFGLTICSTRRRLRLRRSSLELVDSIAPAAQALANVARSTPEGALAYHATGMTDAEGYLAMGCAEVLVHTWDACCGLGVDFVGPPEL